MSAPTDSLAEAERLLGHVVKTFRPECWSGADAGRLVGSFARLERLASAGKALAAGRVEATHGWKDAGHASAEEWLASESGTSVVAATETLATARRLADCPATEDALRSGRLSASQASLVASAASVDPSAESQLLDEAVQGGHERLRRHSRAVRTAALASQCTDTAAIHRSRYLRHWTTEDGAFEGRFRLTPDQGATVLASLRHQYGQVFDEHRREGDREAPDAYEADALVAMAKAAMTGSDGTGAKAAAVLNVRVDLDALRRGWAEAGEVCEIDGIGPVPVSVVRWAANDAILWAVLHRGGRLIDVRWAGRTVPDRLRAALIERDRQCQVPGCDRTRNLEIHHLHPFARGGESSLANLARICRHHHDLITHRGAELSGSWPSWRWRPPGGGGPAEPPADARQPVDQAPPDDGGSSGELFPHNG